MEQWLALLPRAKEVLGLNPPGPSCVEFGLWEEPCRHKGVESEGFGYSRAYPISPATLTWKNGRRWMDVLYLLVKIANM